MNWWCENSSCLLLFWKIVFHTGTQHMFIYTWEKLNPSYNIKYIFGSLIHQFFQLYETWERSALKGLNNMVIQQRLGVSVMYIQWKYKAALLQDRVETNARHKTFPLYELLTPDRYQMCFAIVCWHKAMQKLLLQGMWCFTMAIYWCLRTARMSPSSTPLILILFYGNM